MTYGTGNLSNANSAQAFLAAMDVTLTAEPGISKVDAALVVGTFTWNVYKSAAGVNSLGQDWYFAFGYPTAGANSVCQLIFEGYNNATHQASNYAPKAASVTPAANFANPTAASNLPSSGANIAYLQSANIPTVFSYSYTISANRVHWSIFSGTGNVNAGMTLGIRESPLPVSVDPFPIFCVNPQIHSLISIALSGLPTAISGIQTREPNTLTSQSNSFGCGFCAASAWNGYITVTATIDTYAGFNYTSRVIIQGRTVNTTFLGLIPDLVIGPPQTQNIDAISFILNGVTYTGTRMETSSSMGLYFLNN